MSGQVLDTSVLQELRSHIEKLTHSGQKTLDEKLLKALKNICKQSDKYVERGYQMILHDLQKDHSEIRYSALQIADELFRRSHRFRELLLADMHQIMELTLEIDKDNPLPLPKGAAKALKQKSLQIIHEWHKRFGKRYIRLSLAYTFLKNCIKVDFKELEIQSSIEHQRQVERARKEKEILTIREKKVIKEIEEGQSDIEKAITSMKNCLSLLLPHPKEFFVEVEDEVDSFPKEETPEEDDNKEESSNHGSEDVIEVSSDSDEEIDLRAYGVLNQNYSIEIDLKPEPDKIKVTEENSVIAENARDLYVVLNNRHLTDLKKWIQILTKSGSSNKVKELISLKQKIEALLKMYLELNLPAKEVAAEESDSDTSDLEEVKPKEGFEETVLEPLPSTSKGIGLPQPSTSSAGKKSERASDWAILSQENDIKDPTSALSTIVNIKEKTDKEKTETITLAGSSFLQEVDEPLPSKRKIEPSSSSTDTSRKSKLLAVAPKVPFDLDLYNWENEKVPSAVMKKSHPDAHNFWSTSNCDDDDDTVPNELAASTRVIEFSGKFDPVKWTCRTPLPSGKLCPRKDRLKCPFHGPIVPRDEKGNICAVDGKMPDLPPEKPQVPDWQDPQLLKEIESQTGIDLKMPEKGKGKKKTPKYPGLTDVKAIQNTTYNRLSKKIFKKSSVKRVAATLDAIDHKKFRDKFGDQFNYF